MENGPKRLDVDYRKTG